MKHAKSTQKLLLLLASVALLHNSNTLVYSQELITNYFAAVNREVDLARSIFVETNRAFDEALSESLKLQPAESTEVRYLQISFIVFYSNTNDIGPSFSEMVIPHRLILKQGNVVRSEAATNEIPMNYIRVFDPTKSRVTAELKVFVAVSQGDRSRSVRYLHRTFEFVYHRGWKASKKTIVGNE